MPLTVYDSDYPTCDPGWSFLTPFKAFWHGVCAVLAAIAMSITSDDLGVDTGSGVQVDGCYVMNEDYKLIEDPRVAFYTLRAAVSRLYYAGVWSCDRDVNHNALWSDVRDAAGFERGKSPVPIERIRAFALSRCFHPMRNAWKSATPSVLDAWYAELESDVQMACRAYGFETVSVGCGVGMASEQPTAFRVSSVAVGRDVKPKKSSAKKKSTRKKAVSARKKTATSKRKRKASR